MKLNLIWIRSSADAEFREAIDKYVERIGHFFPIEVIEVPGEKDRQKKSDTSIMHADSARLCRAIPSRGTNVVLDERGELMTSLKFAKWLERVTMSDPHGINFVVGGDVGFDDTVRERATKLLSLSPMTLPHQMARVFLVEQIYRACTIIRNIRYHK